MTKIVRLQQSVPVKFGLQRANRKKRVDLEEYGQLSLFQDQKIRNLPSLSQPFEQALALEVTDTKQAIEWYKRSIESGHFVTDSHCNLGILLFDQGLIQEALFHFAKALSLQPSHAVTHFNLANLYSEQGNYLLAQFHYEAAVNFKADFADAYYNLSVNSITLDRPLEALEYLAKFIQFSEPSNDSNLAQQLHQLIQQNISRL